MKMGKTNNNPEKNIHERTKNNKFKQYPRTPAPRGQSQHMERIDFCTMCHLLFKRKQLTPPAVVITNLMMMGCFKTIETTK